jgi:hypothetical protein
MVGDRGTEEVQAIKRSYEPVGFQKMSDQAIFCTTTDPPNVVVKNQRMHCSPRDRQCTTKKVPYMASKQIVEPLKP